MKINLEYRKKIIKTTIVVILALLFLISLIWFASTFKQLYRTGNLEVDYSITGRPTRLHRPITISDIRVWMTFDYLNVIFKVDPLYFKNTLAITDSKYPNISIEAYARHNRINPQVLLHNIEQAIINYPNNK
ncbi:MAG: hypothetical protein NTV03_00855 [Candidatus Nomurabacteria bacterium]|nr:hypothetical protein [Candidatus Nomurabacteria bacterium]